MYDDKTAEKIKKIAEESIDSTQAKISELNKIGSDAKLESTKLMLGWQSWLGNISFAMSAILGAILINNDMPSIFYIMSFILFLMTGLWIALFHKHEFEKAVILGSATADEFRILYDDKKKAAFQLFMDPTNVARHVEFLKKELEIVKLSNNNNKKSLKDLKNDKTNYLNDFWLAFLVSAIYFLVQPIGHGIYIHFNLPSVTFYIIYWIVWIILMLIIWKYEALSNRDTITDNRGVKIKKYNSHLRHGKEYSDEIKSQINDLEGNIAG